MCARCRGRPPHGRPSSRGSAVHSGHPSPAPLPVLNALLQLRPEARWSLLPLPTPRSKLVSAKRRQQGINTFRDKGFTLGREKEAQAVAAHQGLPRKLGGAGGAAPPPCAGRLGAPCLRCAWPPLWATRGKRRKAPLLDKGCGHPCVARVQEKDRIRSLFSPWTRQGRPHRI